MALIKCEYCGKNYTNLLTSCPHCGGVPASKVASKQLVDSNAQGGPSRKNKTTAVVLCLFLWFIGAHEFYLGNIKMGLWWTFGSIVALIGMLLTPFLLVLLVIPIVVAICMGNMPPEQFAQKYTQPPRLGELTVLALLMGFVYLVFCAFSYTYADKMKQAEQLQQSVMQTQEALEKCQSDLKQMEAAYKECQRSPAEAEADGRFWGGVAGGLLNWLAD